MGKMSYEDALARAELAASFVQHPYWDKVSAMLSGTIQSETEQLLTSDEHREVNRASVAICRKVLQMPFFDIEQGRLARSMYEHEMERMARKRSTQRAPDSARR